MSISEVLHKIIELSEKTLNIFLPKRAGVEILEKMSILEWKNLATPGEIEEIFYIFPYNDKRVRQAIWEIKYRRNKILLHKLSEVVAEFLMEELADKKVLENFIEPVVTSIPSSTQKKNERGHNQSEDLAKEISKKLHLKYETLLEKTKNTPAQSTLRREARLQNLKGSFACTKAPNIHPKNILLIDDIATTGATLFEARKVLSLSGVKKVFCVAVGH